MPARSGAVEAARNRTVGVRLQSPIGPEYGYAHQARGEPMRRGRPPPRHHRAGSSQLSASSEPWQACSSSATRNHALLSPDEKHSCTVRRACTASATPRRPHFEEGGTTLLSRSRQSGETAGGTQSDPQPPHRPPPFAAYDGTPVRRRANIGDPVQVFGARVLLFRQACEHGSVLRVGLRSEADGTAG